ncbi:maleylacetoacetate isomerase [Paracidovorax oryzae]|uniref:maleylacetoacetate isomerase n=1 Tax=Paracidovorax oryzae TaxID=862720 RepID=UPI0002F6E243|nr:maleylacetoacetate isomerase [Paracidovorax oryzae]
MKLFNYFRSSASYRVRIALALKGLPYEYVPVHLVRAEHREPGYADRVGDALVPALELGDGSTLVQSMAIIEYLDEMHPQPPLLPADALGRAHVRALAQMVACEIHPVNNLRVLRYLTQTLGHDEAEKTAWYRHWARGGLEAFERQLGLLARAREIDAPPQARLGARQLGHQQRHRAWMARQRHGDFQQGVEFHGVGRRGVRPIIHA